MFSSTAAPSRSALIRVVAILHVLAAATFAIPALAGEVVGVHRWYENTSPDPIVSVSVHSSLDACRASLRSDVRKQQADWEESRDDYRFRFSTHGCFDTGSGISDDGGQFWVPEDEIFWVNPTFIIEQCYAAGGDDGVCTQVTSEFIEANRNGDATGEVPSPN